MSSRGWETERSGARPGDGETERSGARPVDGETGTGGFERVVAAAHAGYHDESRRHHEPDVLVDDVVTWSMLSPHLMRALMFLVAPTVLVLIWLLLGYLAAMGDPDPVAETINSLVGFVAVLLYLGGLAALFAPAKEPIAEYSQLLEGRAAAAPAAYWWVRRAAEARRAPAEVRPSTVAGVPVLIFRQHTERAMLLVQAYGEDLYVGWTMWRSRSSATMLAHFLRDTFGRFASGPRFSSELRAASTRALRESVHSLSREGVLAAVHLRDPSGGTPVADRQRGEARWSMPDAQRFAPGPSTGDAPRASPEFDAGRGRHTGPAPTGTRPRTGELPQPAPTWDGEHDVAAPRPEYQSRGDHQPGGEAGWGPPPRG